MGICCPNWSIFRWFSRHIPRKTVVVMSPVRQVRPFVWQVICCDVWVASVRISEVSNMSRLSCILSVDIWSSKPLTRVEQFPGHGRVSRETGSQFERGARIDLNVCLVAGHHVSRDTLSNITYYDYSVLFFFIFLAYVADGFMLSRHSVSQ